MPSNGGQPEVRVIRSARRKKTVQGRWVSGNVLEVRVPAWMSRRQEQQAVADILAKASRTARRENNGHSGHSSAASNDADLRQRADKLNRKFLGDRAVIGSVRWVSNQNTRWGSCTVDTGDIRISDRLKQVPDYVLDSVLMHELVHTFIPGHTADFWSWADKAPHAERAKGYLEAYQRWSSQGYSDRD